MEAQGPRQHHRAKVSSKWHCPALCLLTSCCCLPAEVWGPGTWNAPSKSAPPRWKGCAWGMRSKQNSSGELCAQGASEAEGKGHRQAWCAWQHAWVGGETEAQGPRQHHRAKVSSKWHHLALCLPASCCCLPAEVQGLGSWSALPKSAAPICMWATRSKSNKGGELCAQDVSKGGGKGGQIWHAW